jgi:hypothetical protein
LAWRGGGRIVVSWVLSFVFNLLGVIGSQDPTYQAYAAIADPLKIFVVSVFSRIPSLNLWNWHLSLGDLVGLIPAYMILLGLTVMIISVILFASFFATKGIFVVLGPVIGIGIGAFIVAVLWLGWPMSLGGG